MKKLLVGLLALASISSFASEISERRFKVKGIAPTVDRAAYDATIKMKDKCLDKGYDKAIRQVWLDEHEFNYNIFGQAVERVTFQCIKY